MAWLRALIFCGGLLYAAAEDIRTREVSDGSALFIAVAGLVPFSPATIPVGLLMGLLFYFLAQVGATSSGDTTISMAIGFVLGWRQTCHGLKLLVAISAVYFAGMFLAARLRHRPSAKTCAVVPLFAAAFIPAYFI